MCVGAHFANLSSSNTLTFSGYAALPQNFTQMGQALVNCRAGSLETPEIRQLVAEHVNCRAGSLEM